MLPDYTMIQNFSENDDDYDFALELRPDDAYRLYERLWFITFDYNSCSCSRQAAETMESIVDFGSLDLESYTSSQSRDNSEDGMLNCLILDSVHWKRFIYN